MIHIRRATTADAARLLAWANDPVTRAAGFHPAPIDADAHVRWLGQQMASPSARLYIGEEDAAPVGQVRIEVGPHGRAEVSISVAPEARGRGVGRELLEASLAAGRDDPDLAIETFIARIRPGNDASVALFHGAGFRHTRTEEVDGVRCLVYELRAG